MSFNYRRTSRSVASSMALIHKLKSVSCLLATFMAWLSLPMQAHSVAMKSSSYRNSSSSRFSQLSRHIASSSSVLWVFPCPIVSANLGIVANTSFDIVVLGAADCHPAAADPGCLLQVRPKLRSIYVHRSRTDGRRDAQRPEEDLPQVDLRSGIR